MKIINVIIALILISANCFGFYNNHNLTVRQQAAHEALEDDVYELGKNIGWLHVVEVTLLKFNILEERYDEIISGSKNSSEYKRIEKLHELRDMVHGACNDQWTHSAALQSREIYGMSDKDLVYCYDDTLSCVSSVALTEKLTQGIKDGIGEAKEELRANSTVSKPLSTLIDRRFHGGHVVDLYQVYASLQSEAVMIKILGKVQEYFYIKRDLSDLLNVVDKTKELRGMEQASKELHEALVELYELKRMFNN